LVGSFRIVSEIERDEHDWGHGHWISHPPSTGAKQLTVLEATIIPGQGHSFHKHPDQEEVLYVGSGKVEQWINKQKTILGPGDAAFIPAGTVHASFTVGQTDAKVIAIFSPSVGGIGFEMVGVANEAPWKNLRG
jgi:quercetin dioxygenase-like cupin family protein